MFNQWPLFHLGSKLPSSLKLQVVRVPAVSVQEVKDLTTGSLWLSVALWVCLSNASKGFPTNFQGVPKGFPSSRGLMASTFFPQTVHCWGTQFYLKVCPPCVRGCVRLRTICLPIHLSPNSFVSQVLCQGLCPPPGDLSPNSFVSQFICLPGPVSGAVSASGGFVSQFICPPCVRGCVRLRTICLPIHLSPNSFVSQFICLPIHLSPRSLSPNSFVSQVLWQGLCPPPGDWFPNSFVSQFICLPGPVSGAVSAFGGFVSQFVCLPSFPKQLTVGVLNSILRCVRLVSGAVSASLGSVSPISPQTVYCWRSQFSFKRCPAMFRWWCPALRLSPIHVSSLVAIDLSPNLAGGVQLSGCLQFICLALWQLICLPVWLVVSGSSAVSVTLVMSGSLAVSNSFVSKSGWWRLCLPNDSFVSQSGWWCPAFRLAPIHLSPLVTLHLSPSLAGGVRLSGCLQFICFRLVAIHLSPSLAGGVRLSMLSAVSNSFVFPCGN